VVFRHTVAGAGLGRARVGRVRGARADNNVQPAQDSRRQCPLMNTICPMGVLVAYLMAAEREKRLDTINSFRRI